ncbi:GDCCVxC domain-containing (seleno)protein [Paraburkholderia sp. BR14320]|uniref:GDCCVxC domain-containing (seleno)protein n=1 Tax=unclassified Paraburkholderia TaxID=2615204 RepID=UPI0034CD7D1A
MQTSPILESALTCPHCGGVSVVTMPTDACDYFYECPRCKSLLSPKSGDCCVFCSYGTVKCPSVQEAGACCAKSVTRAGPSNNA